jgi:hypothetical protein
METFCTARRLERQAVAAGIGGPSVQVLPRCRNATVAESGLNQMDRTTSVQGMGRMGMAEPMARYVCAEKIIGGSGR